MNPILLFGGLLLIWGAIFWGLRYFLGSASRTETLKELFAYNTTKLSLCLTFVNASLFLGVLWVFALLGFRFAPHFLRRVSLIIPLYVVTILVWGAWMEVRLLMPLYPIVVPLGLSFLYLREPNKEEIL